MIEEQIKSVADFYTNFCPNEDRAKEIFEKVRWGDTLRCPYCKGEKIYRMKSKIQPYKCHSCQRKYTVKTGTILQNSKASVQQWLYAIYVMKINIKGISSLRLAAELGITQKTAWYMLQKIRECFIDRSSKLTGVVEMDETFIGGLEGNKHKDKKNNAGRGTVGKATVIGAIQRDNKRVIAYPIPEANVTTVGRFINHHVEKYTDIMADESKVYDRYTMLRVNHGKKQWADGLVHTNSIESYWAIVKRGYMGVYHWWSEKHLHRYMREYTYRFNRRRQNNVSFLYEVLYNGRCITRTFKEIIA